MKRDYSNASTPQLEAAFFHGVEVEHTPAHGMHTLFVVGVQTVRDILDKIDELYTNNSITIKHIYFGANQSFNAELSEDWAYWEGMVKGLLAKGYWATLDVGIDKIIPLHEAGLCEFNQFIPMISVKVPYIALLNYNATIKIDDVGFQASNPGVWCHRVHDLMDSSKYTSWDKYKGDQLL